MSAVILTDRNRPRRLAKGNVLDTTARACTICTMTSKGMTIDVGDWLRGLGLGQYEPSFRENEIDESVLPGLTAEDLKDLGVSIVGHRRKLLDAIAGLRAEKSAKPPTLTPSSLPRSTAGAGCSSTRGKYCRAPPSHRAVLGPCRLHGAFGSYGPGGPA